MSIEKELNLEFFREKGFVRKKCKKCGSWFWSLDADRITCGDQPCEDFGFIGNPPTSKPYSLDEMRESFLKFFEGRGHEVLKPYPVVARWRKDIYLTIASIADFQPHVTSGKVPPPANPLVISQPSIRLNDLEQVGVSGKHLTIFEMMGHHAFNSKEKFVYWTEETVSYCHEFLSERVGIAEENISYKESFWEGGGNAGPCLEVISNGLEIATLVFMNLEEREGGSIKLNGKEYSQMKLKVVDTGYGLERLVWLTSGSKTVYDAIYPDVVEIIKRESQTKNPQAVYALADHGKCILFMLGDGIVPSNVRAGYLARLMIRRALRFLQVLGIEEDFLFRLMEMHNQHLSKNFPHLAERKDVIEEMLKIEIDKYRDALSKGKKLVERILKEKKKLGREELIKLYDSHGIHPETIKSMGIEVEVPENFDSLVAGLHSCEEVEEKEEISLPELPETRKLYYEDSYLKSFDAEVIWSGEIGKKNCIILDKTAFYPEGGGQPSDMGYIVSNGKRVEIEHVESVNGKILHFVDKKIEKGSKVRGFVDWQRRYALMRHHTATHLINGICRMLFGEHIWQAGSNLEENEARFDFTHYKPLTMEEIEKIERKANELIRKGLDVEKEFMERNEAEKKYGIRLFQGGVPEGRIIRVVRIPGIDVEACGGTHLNNIREIGRLRILRAERIQDGINRIVFVAGTEKVKAVEEWEENLIEEVKKRISRRLEIEEEVTSPRKALHEISTMFSVPIDRIPKTVDKFLKDLPHGKEGKAKDVVDACRKIFIEWKKLQKSRKRVPSRFVEKLRERKERIGKVNLIIIGKEEIGMYDPVSLAEEMVKEKGYVVCINDGKSITMAASEDIDVDLRPLAMKIGKILGGGGGGREKLVRCGGKNVEKLNKAIEEARRIIAEELG